ASVLGTGLLTACASQGSAGAAQAGTSAKAAVARSIAASDLTTREVAGLTVIEGAGCNVVALNAAEGALMIDGGLAANSAVLLKSLLARTGASRVQTLINTHWHPEQTGSNEAVGKAGGTIIAHEVTKLALGAKVGNLSAMYEGKYGPLANEGLPTVTTYNKGSLEIGGEPVEYRYLPGAHTNGDLFVYFPRRNVLVAGGPVGSDRW